MRFIKFGAGTFALATVLILADRPAMAQSSGMGAPPIGRPKRRLHKSRAPVLSPSLNLLPGAVTSFEGQFLLRQLPQEQAIRQAQQTGRALDTLQTEIGQQNKNIPKGIGRSGHRVR